MLQHEPEEQADPTPAAQRRVTADELAQAVNALEASKDEAARHLAGTVPIGEVVEELKLAATPEEVWAQVQRQRAQAAQEATRVTPPVVPVPPIQAKTVGRRLVRGWRDAKSWLWILFWCTGGMGLLSAIPHWIHQTSSTAGIHVSGDNSVSTYTVHHEDAQIDGEDNKIILRGEVQKLTVEGDNNTVTVIGTVEAISTDGDGNTVHWTKELPGKTIRPDVTGDSNHVGLSAP